LGFGQIARPGGSLANRAGGDKIWHEDDNLRQGLVVLWCIEKETREGNQEVRWVELVVGVWINGFQR